ncbi:MAG TPA: GyrI-like domain-containing protein [Syntrophomonas sp.]|nr:GyrI-like domain-containing protein [Syntrophomonas sp.]
MAFDYKKEYKEFYLPKNQPQIITVPPMNFVAVRGCGDPNEAGGEYQTAINLLYGIAFTIKMSYKGDHKIEGYFEYVVPPLEGFWWMQDEPGVDYRHKDKFAWISAIRLPEFVAEADFEWAVGEAAKKKKTDFSRAEFFTYDEGLCVQCMHIGAYDDEPATVAAMDTFAQQQGLAVDLSPERFHHEIYLSDPRKSSPDKLKTVLRHPVKII